MLRAEIESAIPVRMCVSESARARLTLACIDYIINFDVLNN